MTGVLMMSDPEEILTRENRRKDIRNYVIGGLAILLIVAITIQVLTALQGQDTATAQRDQAVAEKVSLADQIQGECEAGRLTGPICVRSDQITKQTAPTPEPGPPGRGIKSTDVINGRLFVTYTDGAVVDVGGVKGPDGRGITVTEIKDGHLVVTYSDGVARDLGTVVGPAGDKGVPGTGIKSVVINDKGELVINYTDGTSANVGKVVGPSGPSGPQGPAGPAGPACQPDEHVEDYKFADGKTGSRCVDNTQTTTTTTPMQGG